MSKPSSAIHSETDLIQCPYNVSHLILRHRFQVHLVKCRKSYPNSEMSTCPFNSSHRITKKELDWHVSICPERYYYERFTHSSEPIIGLSSSIDRSFRDTGSQSTFVFDNAATSTIAEEFVESSENWDIEPAAPSYNPIEYTLRSDVLRMPVGLSPSQRCAFRLAERKRLQSINK